MCKVFKMAYQMRGTIYDDFNESLIVSADRQAEISQEMDNAQNTITEIASTATETEDRLHNKKSIELTNC